MGLQWLLSFIQITRLCEVRKTKIGKLTLQRYKIFSLFQLFRNFFGDYIHDGTNMIVKTETLYLRVLCKERMLRIAVSISLSDNYSL